MDDKARGKQQAALNQAVRSLSEVERIDYGRRVDECLALMYAGATVADERRAVKEVIGESRTTLRGKGYWIAFAVGSLVVWSGGAIEVGFISGVGYVVMFFAGAGLLGAMFDEIKAEGRRDRVEAEARALVAKWIATGSDPLTLNSYMRAAEASASGISDSDALGLQLKARIEVMRRMDSNAGRFRFLDELDRLDDQSSSAPGSRM